MGKLEIRLLGGLEIGGDRDTGAPVLSGKARALVAYLALQHGRPQSREKLAALFWQDSPEEQARTNLRQAISTVRKALNDHRDANLVADRNQVALTGWDIDFDVTEFERLIAEATPDALVRAVALYKGDLLDGFSLKEASFETWVRAERERLRHLASDALTKLTEHYSTVGDADRCVETAARLLNLDPLREAVHRILMRAYAAQGRHASALKQFEACRDMLKRELDVEPEPETVALYRDIRKQRALAVKGDDGAAKKLAADHPPLPNGLPLGDENANIVGPGAERALRWPVIAAGLSGLIVLVGVILWQHLWAPREEPASVEAMAFPLPDKPSIAVLPFNNISDDASQDYFADGMTEDVITDLSKISGLFVIARNSTFAYKSQQVKLRQVAEELGVRYVLEGSVRRAGDEVRINVQLIDATTGGHLWADRYDGNMDDVFDLQDQVTAQIVAALAVSLTGAEQAQQASHNTENAAAYDAYLQGWARYKLLTPENLAAAVPFFEEAIRRDPNYDQAHAALASVYWDAYRNDWAFDLGMPSFRAESRANDHLAEALKGSAPLAHALQARIMASLGFYDDAVAEAKQAVALDANDATAHAGLAEALVLAGKPAKAIDAIEIAIRLDPHHPPDYLIILGAAQFGMERFDKAASTFVRAVRRNPDNKLPWIYLASSFGHLGRVKDADNAIEAANDIRAKLGKGDLTLERASRYFSPFQGEIEFKRFGGEPAQMRLRAGLNNIPALTWQYRITQFGGSGKYGRPSYEVEGVTEIDIQTAKSLYDRGAVFIDASNEDYWNQAHITGAIHLPFGRSTDPEIVRFRESTLREVAKIDDEIVLHCFDQNCPVPAFAAAKAANWGYQHVYTFVGGAPAWQEAGYPIETGE
jgi:TolB-like protein/DNA-binding SARP family transcriptional activator/rhodanese-related sulfurtransferase